MTNFFWVLFFFSSVCSRVRHRPSGHPAGRRRGGGRDHEPHSGRHMDRQTPTQCTCGVGGDPQLVVPTGVRAKRDRSKREFRRLQCKVYAANTLPPKLILKVARRHNELLQFESTEMQLVRTMIDAATVSNPLVNSPSMPAILTEFFCGIIKKVCHILLKM